MDPVSGVVGQLGTLSLESDDLLVQAKKALAAKEYKAAYDAFLSVTYRRSDRQMLGEAYFALFTLLHERQVEVSDREGLRDYYIKQAVRYDNPEAAVKFAIFYIIEDPNTEKRLYEIGLQSRSDETKAKAQYHLGLIAEKEKEFALAEKYFRELADGDSTYRQKAAMQCVEFTRHKDLEAAAKYTLRSASDPHNPCAATCFDYAQLQERRRIPEAYRIARGYYKWAADDDKGDADTKAKAAFCYAEMVEDARGGPSDPNEAKRYYKQAADGEREKLHGVQARASHMYAYRLWIEDPKGSAEIEKYKARARALRYEPPENLAIPPPVWHRKVVMKLRKPAAGPG